jgi:uncharacterized membrane protein YhhN
VNGTATAALVVAGLAAVVDWWAVARKAASLEYVAKPVATLALLVVAATVDTDVAARRGWFVLALALCLAGDVLLMLPKERFVPGLVAFLLRHLAYLAGLWSDDRPGGVRLVVGLALVLAVVLVLARRILAGLRTSGQGALALPVAASMGVIAAMTSSATGSGPGLAIAGAWLFLASDGLLAWNKFVRPLRWAPVGIMVTYHLAQAGLALSLA